MDTFKGGFKSVSKSTCFAAPTDTKSESTIDPSKDKIKKTRT